MQDISFYLWYLEYVTEKYQVAQLYDRILVSFTHEFV